MTALEPCPRRRVRVRSPAAASELLRERPGRVRLLGSGSRQARLPDPGDALHLDLGGLAAIVRLDAPDQTCTVECGVPRVELDRELARVGLELPCPGGGTIGGLFASDPLGAATHGGHAPRTLLLGMDALLANGTPFRAGARVVKSVAGFDVHKLLVGSQGRLFLATRLHLRLKPAPRATEWFAATGLDAQHAHALVGALRRGSVAPAALQLERAADGACAVRGRVAGRASFVASTLAAHTLPPGPPAWRDHLEPPAGGEVVAGTVLPSRLPALLGALPAEAPFLWHGGGRFEAALAAASATDALLAALPGLTIQACVVHAAPARRGLGTPLDPGQRRLADRLRAALDPDGILV